MEKQKFEQEWKDAFDQAEVSPSENLWTNIELNLEKAEAGKMKSRLLFYKLTAAASIVFAMCIAGAWAYYSITTANLNSHMVADKTGATVIQMNSDNHVDDVRKDESIEKNNVAGVIKKRDEKNQETLITSDQTDQHSSEMLTKSEALMQTSNSNLSTGASNQQASTLEHHDVTGVNVLNKAENTKNNVFEEHNKIEEFAVVKKNEKNQKGNLYTDFQQEEENRDVTIPVQLKLNERKMPPLTNVKKITITWPEQDPVAVMMAKLEQRERELMDDEEKKQDKKTKHPDSKGERLWTSVGFAAGSFGNINSNSSSSLTSSNTLASNSVTTNQGKAPGTSYSMGMNVGTRLSPRWVLQGGVNYLSQNSSYEANSAIGSIGNANDFQAAAASINSLSVKNTQFQAGRLTAALPYVVDNNVRFVSVPVQAGYMVINHAVGVQVNGGMSTDLFLQNTLTAQSSNLPKVTQNNGDDSPYRTVNFSGLFGTEVSYRFSKHYRLALNPGLRYPLNSIYKSDAGIKANPLTFDVGMRFRYIFH